MKASELDKGLKVVDPSSTDDDERVYYLHPQRIPVYEAYRKVGQVFERTVHDRVWDWWLSLVTSDPVKNQEIKKVVSQLYRTKDPDGKEWLFYNCDVSGNDWKGNRKDFSYLEGVTEGMPTFNYEVEISTNKVIPGTTQVLEVVKKYTIPFSKEKVEELSKHFNFRNPLSCIVIAPDSRKYSVSLEQFKSMSYNELVDMVTGYADYMKNRRGQKVYS